MKYRVANGQGMSYAKGRPLHIPPFFIKGKQRSRHRKICRGRHNNLRDRIFLVRPFFNRPISDTIKTQTNRVSIRATTFDALRKLAETDPYYYTGCNLYAYCLYCNSPDVDPHDEKCLWFLANEELKKEKERCSV